MRASSNTVHLDGVSSFTENSFGWVGARVRRSGYPDILRLTPRGTRRPRLLTQRSSRISSSSDSIRVAN